MVTEADCISMPTEVMAPLIYAGVNGLLDKVDTDKITAWEKSLYVVPQKLNTPKEPLN